MASRAVTHGLSARDRQVVELVAKFRQLTSGQIRDSLFAELASTTPLDRTLKRLVERKHLSRLKRLVGGDQGGSGQYVYQLGRAGWKLLGKPGAYWAPRTVNPHTLAVADCYVTLKQAEQRDELAVIQFTTEPECHRAVGDVLLTPDAHIEIGDRINGVKQTCYLEIDRGTERIDVIRAKCIRYWKAYQSWSDEYFPRVVFSVPDESRLRVLKRVCSEAAISEGGLFGVCTHAVIVRTIMRQ